MADNAQSSDTNDSVSDHSLPTRDMEKVVDMEEVMDVEKVENVQEVMDIVDVMNMEGVMDMEEVTDVEGVIDKQHQYHHYQVTMHHREGMAELTVQLWYL